MNKLTEQELEITHRSLLDWILIIVKANVLWYVCLLIFNLISDLRSPDEVITWQSIILATLPNWHSFLNACLLMLVIGLLIAIAAWRFEIYWRERTL